MGCGNISTKFILCPRCKQGRNPLNTVSWTSRKKILKMFLCLGYLFNDRVLVIFMEIGLFGRLMENNILKNLVIVFPQITIYKTELKKNWKVVNIFFWLCQIHKRCWMKHVSFLSNKSWMWGCYDENLFWICARKSTKHASIYLSSKEACLDCMLTSKRA